LKALNSRVLDSAKTVSRRCAIFDSRRTVPTGASIAVQKPNAIAGAAAFCVSVFGPPVKGAEPEMRYDFIQPLDGCETVSGTWVIEDVPGASQGGKALVQRAIDKAFNVIAPGGPYANIVVDVRFKPISGREDASGGIVFRFSESHFCRHLITGVSVEAPALGQWHKVRVTAESDHIKGWLNDQLLIDYRDGRFGSGKAGLWTKTDSITAFGSLAVRHL